MNQKYELLNDTWTLPAGAGRVRRIRALRSFGDGDDKVVAGQVGGWVESEYNLSHNGSCWISDSAMARERSCVSGNARLSGHAEVSASAKIGGNARICDTAHVTGNVEVSGDAVVSGDTCLGGAQNCDLAGLSRLSTPQKGRPQLL